MRINRRSRRFGAHPVEDGPFKGSLHVSTEKFQRFRGEMLVLEDYLDSWLLPQDPEEVRMTRIILMLQNVLEHLSEFAIYEVVLRSSNPEDRRFHNSIVEGYSTFKSKFEWLFTKGLITETDKSVMDQIRKIRNEQIHLRPSAKRQRLKYFDTALLTRKAVRQILLDVQPIVEKLGRISGVTPPSVIPPRFFDENEWVLLPATVVRDSAPQARRGYIPVSISTPQSRATVAAMLGHRVFLPDFRQSSTSFSPALSRAAVCTPLSNTLVMLPSGKSTCLNTPSS